MSATKFPLLDRRGGRSSTLINFDSRGRLYNATQLKNRRRELRNSSTSVEAVLWKSLQNRKLAGKKFRRQMSIGPYIVDFFCPECKLAIELDERDAKRTAYLEREGIHVMRFENRIIYEDMENVLALIRQRVLADA